MYYVIELQEDDCGNIFAGKTPKEAIDNYEACSDESFKKHQGNLVFLIKAPQKLEVEFTMVVKEVPTIINKEKSNAPRK